MVDMVRVAPACALAAVEIILARDMIVDDVFGELKMKMQKSFVMILLTHLPILIEEARILILSQWKTTTGNNNNSLTIRIQIKRNRRTVVVTTILHPRLHLNQKMFFIPMYVQYVWTMYHCWIQLHFVYIHVVGKSCINSVKMISMVVN